MRSASWIAQALGPCSPITMWKNEITANAIAELATPWTAPADDLLEVPQPVARAGAKRSPGEVGSPERPPCLDLDPLWSSLRPPLAAGVLEVADEFLLLRVHGDDGLAAPLEGEHAAVYAPKLTLAVRMASSLLGLPVGLQRVPRLCQDLTDGHVADAVPHGLEARGQLSEALRTPAQRGLGIPGCRRFHEGHQIGEQSGILVEPRLPAASRPPHAPRLQRLPGLQLLQTAPDRRLPDARRTPEKPDTAPSECLRLGGGPEPSPSLSQLGRNRLELRPDRAQVHIGLLSVGARKEFSYC